MPGPTEQTYTTVQADVGASLSCRVTATNAQGSVSATSAGSAAVLAKEPVNTVTPVISGGSNPPEVGETLTVSNGTWTGITPITYDYFWERNGTQQPVDNLNTYELTSSDLGATIRARVKAVNVHTPVGVDAYTSSTAAVVGAGTDPGLQILIDNNFTWLRGSELANGATGNWVPSSATSGTGTALIGGTSGAEASDPSVSGGILTFDGTDDYVQLAANGLPTFTAPGAGGTPAGSGAYTMLVVERHTSAPSGTQRIFSTESALNKGTWLGFLSGSLRALVGGATSQLEVTVGTLTLNRVNVVGLTVSSGSNLKGWADDIGITANPGDLSGIGTITNFSSARIGRRAHSSTFFFNGTIYDVLYAPVGLTESQLTQVSSYLRSLHP